MSENMEYPKGIKPEHQKTEEEHPDLRNRQELESQGWQYLGTEYSEIGKADEDVIKDYLERNKKYKEIKIARPHMWDGKEWVEDKTVYDVFIKDSRRLPGF
ncbi:MAG: hypothetical protein BMS9Abin13_259 [Patescibacteria group bacterium]|nr:MAG: hypothetical protein BMS9Abin13_259 [Patescibacteria group bacterium]